MLANARMYSVTPASAEAWRTIIGWATREAGVPVEFVEHAPPKLLSELWARGDLGCVQMCGLPASLREPKPTILAAPQPSLPRYGGKAVYMSDIAVRADAPFRTLEDTFGGVAGYTLKDSQSGYFAFRTLLMTKYPARNTAGSSAGCSIRAASSRRSPRARSTSGRWMATCSTSCAPAIPRSPRRCASWRVPTRRRCRRSSRLRRCARSRFKRSGIPFLRLHEERSLDDARKALLVERFVVPELADYDVTKRRAERVEREGEPWP